MKLQIAKQPIKAAHTILSLDLGLWDRMKTINPTSIRKAKHLMKGKSSIFCSLDPVSLSQVLTGRCPNDSCPNYTLDI
jgi:hypothetical protein